MSDLKSEQRAWLKRVVEQTGMSLTAIARKAGKHDSTLTGFMNGERQNALQTSTVRAIEKATGVPYSEEQGWFSAVRSTSQWDAEEAAPVDVSQLPPSPTHAALQALDPKSQEIWKLQSNDLLAAGYRPGDYLIVERQTAPSAHDVVIVQKAASGRRAAHFTALLYQPPFVVAAAMDPRAAARPELVDGDAVRIIGTVVAMIRAGRLSS